MREPALGEPALGVIEHGAIAVKDDRIAWVGAMREMPAELQSGKTHDCGRALITPGLIDCHTHVVHGGHRATEFELRLNGASYEEVARAGGGIISTVRATRAASRSLSPKRTSWVATLSFSLITGTAPISSSRVSVAVTLR